MGELVTLSQNVGYSIYNFLQRYQADQKSTIVQIWTKIFGEESIKQLPLSAVDGMLIVTQGAGIILGPIFPPIGLPLLFLSTAGLGIRRGAVATLATPLVVIVTATNPNLAKKLLYEAIGIAATAVNEGTKLAFTLTGVLVTTGGAIVAYVFTQKKSNS